MENNSINIFQSDKIVSSLQSFVHLDDFVGAGLDRSSQHCCLELVCFSESILSLRKVLSMLVSIFVRTGMFSGFHKS